MQAARLAALGVAVGIVVALPLAALVPARKAMLVNPLTALRID